MTSCRNSIVSKINFFKTRAISHQMILILTSRIWVQERPQRTNKMYLSVNSSTLPMAITIVPIIQTHSGTRTRTTASRSTRRSITQTRLEPTQASFTLTLSLKTRSNSPYNRKAITTIRFPIHRLRITWATRTLVNSKISAKLAWFKDQTIAQGPRPVTKTASRLCSEQGPIISFEPILSFKLLHYCFLDSTLCL